MLDTPVCTLWDVATLQAKTLSIEVTSLCSEFTYLIYELKSRVKPTIKILKIENVKVTLSGLREEENWSYVTIR